MSAARAAILERLRCGLGRSSTDDGSRAAADRRLAGHPRGIVPARTEGTADELLERFVAGAEGVAATVVRVAKSEAVPDAVAEYLISRNIAGAVRVSPEAALDRIPWERRPTLTVARGGTDGSDAVAVTAALCAVAETGTLVLSSGPDRPPGLAFLPDTHIVVLPAAAVVGSYEDAWDRLRAAGTLPSTVNLITGPSRTGDIEQTIELGAHGPRRLHIVVVGEA